MALLRTHQIQSKRVGFFLQVIIACYGSTMILGKKPASYMGKLRLHRRNSLDAKPGPHNNLSEDELDFEVVPPERYVKVEFGILVKEFYGIDFLSGTVTTDSVIFSRWTDKKNKHLIPRGEEALRVSLDAAEGEIWNPAVHVSNVAQDGYSPISTSFLIESGGITTKVERALLTTKNSFEFNEFPFDKQVLQIRLASRTYMDDEVGLVPISNQSLWGADENLFQSWDLMNASIFTFLDTDGLLSKSRGVLQLIIKRPTDQFACCIFVPSIMLVAMSWSSLWLPLQQPFAMPRIALNAIALLAEVTLATHVASMTPQGTLTWLDEYLECCFLLQFILLGQTIAVLTLKNRFSEGEYAEKMTFHLLWFFPIMWGFSVILMSFAIDLVPIMILTVMIAYIGYHLWDYHVLVHEEDLRKGTSSKSLSPQTS